MAGEFVPVRELLKQNGNGTQQGQGQTGFVPVRELLKQNDSRQKTAVSVPDPVVSSFVSKFKSAAYKPVDAVQRLKGQTPVHTDVVSDQYIADYMDRAEKYYSGALTDQEVGSWEYMTNPISVKERNLQAQVLKEQSANIRAWFKENKDQFDSEEYDMYMAYLDGLEEQQAGVSAFYEGVGKLGSQAEYNAELNRSNWQQQYMDAETLNAYNRLVSLQDNGGAPAELKGTEQTLQRLAGNVDLKAVKQRINELNGLISTAQLKIEDAGILEQELAQLQAWYDMVRYYKYIGKYGDLSYEELQQRISGNQQMIDNADRMPDTVWQVNNTTPEQLQDEQEWLKAYAPTRKTGADYIKENNNILLRIEQDLETVQNADARGGTQGDPGSTTLKYGICAGYGVIYEQWKASTGKTHGDAEEFLKWYKQQLKDINEYSFLCETPDFEEKSQYDSDIAHKDPLYAAVGGYGHDTNLFHDVFYEKYMYMEYEESQIFFYLYHTQGRAAAKEYLNAIDMTLTARATERYQDGIAAFVDNTNGWGGLLAEPVRFVGGLLTAPEYISKYLWNKGKELVTGEDQRPVNMSSLGQFVGTLGDNLSSATVQYIQDQYDGAGEVLLTGGYQLTNQAIQMGLQILTANIVTSAGGSQALAKGITNMLMSGSAYTSTVLDVRARGGTDDQAMAAGMAAGVFEWLFENYELDQLLKAGDGGFVRSFLRNAFSEGLGEGATTLSNELADRIIMGDLSNFNVSVENYKAELIRKGLSPEDAERQAKKQAWIDFGKNVGTDAFMGLLGGGIFGSFKSVVSNTQLKKAFGGTRGDLLVSNILNADPDNKLALQAKERLQSGKKLSTDMLSRLVAQNPQIAADTLAYISRVYSDEFKGQSGTQWNAAQGQLLDAIPDDVLARTDQKLGKTALTFDIVELQNDPQAQQAWKDAGLTWEQLGQTYIKMSALKDEIAWRQKYSKVRSKFSAPTVKQDAASAQTAAPEEAVSDPDTTQVQQPAAPTGNAPVQEASQAQQTVQWAEEAFGRGELTQEELDGIRKAAAAYDSSNPGVPSGAPAGNVSNPDTASSASAYNAETVSNPDTARTNYDNGGVVNESSETGELSGRSGQRNVGSGAPGQARSVASRTEGRGPSVNQARAAIQRQNSAKDIRKVSSKEIGVQSGTDTANLKVLPVELWDSDLQSVAERVKQKTGKDVTFVLGTIEVIGESGSVTNVRGVINESKVVIQADNTRISVEQIGDHEIYHDYAQHDRTLNRQLRRYIENQHSAEEFNAVLEKYIVGLSNVINIPDDASSRAYDAAIDAIIEEILADAYAGINSFGAHAEQFNQAIAEGITQLGYNESTAQENGTRQTDGPPVKMQEHFSIEEIYGHNGEYGQGVILDTNIFDGVHPHYWGGILSKYVYQHFAGQSITLYDEHGNAEVIQFAREKDRVAKDGARSTRKAIDELARYRGDNIRALATIHLPELLITAGYQGVTNEHRHQWLDEHGWELRTAYIVDRNDFIYSVTLNIANARDGRRILYAINNIRKIDKRKEVSPAAQVSSPKLGGTRSTSNDTSLESLPQNEKKVKEVFSVDDSGPATDPDTATQELIEKLRSFAPAQMMGDDVDQLVNQYVQKISPKPAIPKIKVDRRNLINALTGTLKLDKQQQKQMKDILNSYTEQVTQYAKEERERRKKEPATESKPLKAKKNLRNTLLAMFSIPSGMRAELGVYINSFADRIVKNGKLTNADRKTLFDYLYDSGVMTVPADELYQEGRAYLTDARIYVSDDLRQEFGDDWAAFRRRAFGAGIYLTKDRNNRGIDQWNVDLSEDLPGLFNSEETDRKTILERIVQVAQEGKDEHISLAEYVQMLAGEEHVSESEILDDMERSLDDALRGFAEAADIEIKLRDSEARQKAKERAERAEAAQRQKERKALSELQQNALKTLKWLQRNRDKSPSDIKNAIDSLLDDIDVIAVGAANEMNWSKKHGATWRDLSQMYAEAKAHCDNFLPSDELEKVMDRLHGSKLEDLDVDELADLYRAAVQLKTELANRRYLLGEEAKQAMQDVYADSVREIEDSKGEKKHGPREKFMDIAMLSPMNIFQRIGGWDPNGTFYSMARQLEKAELDKQAYIVKSNRMLEVFLREHQGWVKKADGQGKGAIWYEYEVPAVLVRMGDRPKSGHTVKVYMTPAQKVHMYLESKNKDNLRHMRGGRTFVNKKLYSEGKRDQAFAQGITVKLEPSTVRSMVSDLTQEEQELADLLHQYYNVFSKEAINKVSNILYGYDKALTNVYAPIHVNKAYNAPSFGIYDETAEGVGNMKSRVRSWTPTYNISAFDAFERSVDQTARFVSMSIPVRNFRLLLNWADMDYRNPLLAVIEQKWGSAASKYVLNMIEDLQKSIDDESDPVSTITDKMFSKYISSVFAFNPSIVMKQLGSVSLASAYLGAKNKPSLKQQYTVDHNLINKYTSVLAWRSMGYATPELKHLKENPNFTKTNKLYKFFLGGGAITAMDHAASSKLWPWAENKVRRDLPDLEVGTPAQINAGESPFYRKVAEVFEYALNRSQSVSDEMHQGKLRKSKNAAARAVMLFKSDSSQAYNTLRQKIGEASYYRKHGTPEEKKAASWALSNAFLSYLKGAVYAELVTLMWALIKGTAKRYKDDEGELTFESIAEEVVSGLFENAAGFVPGGDIIYQFIDGLVSDGTFWGVEAPGLEQLNGFCEDISKSTVNIVKFLKGWHNVVDNGGDGLEYLKRHASDILGDISNVCDVVSTYLVGFPTENLKAYLIHPIMKLSPEFYTAYEDAVHTAEKQDLSGLSGGALSYRVGSILSNRNVSEDRETADVLADLYSAGYTDVIPSNTPTSITVDGEERELDAYQQQVYDKVWAEVVSDGLDELISSDGFKESSEDQQMKMIRNLYNYASEIAKAELFDDFEMSSGTVKFQGALDVGLSAAEYLNIKSAYDSFDNEPTLKASEKATTFSHWVDMRNYTDEQSAFIKENLKYWVQMPAQASSYEKLSQEGLDANTSVSLADALAQLEPEDGKTQVNNQQKWRTVIQTVDDPEQQLAALSTMMSDSQFAKCSVACDNGLDPDLWVMMQEVLPMYDKNENGSYSQEEIKMAIDGVGGDLGARAVAGWWGLDIAKGYRHMSKKEKAVLWQLLTGAETAKNNPYDVKTGEKVLKKYKKLRDDLKDDDQ